MHGVHRTCAETAAVSCGTSHDSAVSTPLRWIFKKRAIKLVTHAEPHASAVSLLESGEQHYIKAIIIIFIIIIIIHSQFRSCVRVEVAVLGCPS